MTKTFHYIIAREVPVSGKGYVDTDGHCDPKLRPYPGLFAAQGAAEAVAEEFEYLWGGTCRIHTLQLESP